jgi:hypothetical protein
MALWLTVWLVVTLVTTVVLAAVLIAMVRQLQLLVRTGKRMADETGPLTSAIGRGAERASTRVAGARGRDR